MARVYSQKTRKLILSTDAEWDESLPPDKLVLFDQNGNVIDLRGSITGDGMPPGGDTGQILAKASNTDFDAGWVDAPTGGGDGGGGDGGTGGVGTDPDALHFKGVYASGTEYHNNDVVIYQSRLWLAPGDIQNIIPAVASGSLVTTLRNVPVYTTDKVSGTRQYEITSSSAVNDFAGKRTQPAMLDKLDASDVSFTVKNLSPGDLATAIYTASGFESWLAAGATLAEGQSASATVSGTTDRFLMVYYFAGGNGSFEVAATPADKLAGPPTATWTLLASLQD